MESFHWSVPFRDASFVAPKGRRSDRLTSPGRRPG